MPSIVTAETTHAHARHALGLGDGAVLVGEEERLQVDNLLAELRHLRAQGIVLAAEYLDFGLQIGQPLLFPLSTFESRDAVRGKKKVGPASAARPT